MSTLERRLARLENVLLPKAQISVCMLREPASDAPAEEWAEYRRQVDEAKARGDFLILLVPMKPTESPRTEKGVTYCGTELDALAVEGVDASVQARQQERAGRRDEELVG
jgi:hypothetical protein